MLIEIVDVLAADDVDLGVPVAVEGVELLYLLLLLVGELREIFLDDVHIFLFIIMYIDAKVRHFSDTTKLFDIKPPNFMT